MKKTTDNIIFARMPAEEIKGIKKNCKRQDVTLSQIIRKLLRLWNKEGQKIFEENV